MTFRPSIHLNKHLSKTPCLSRICPFKGYGSYSNFTVPINNRRGGDAVYD